MQKECATENGMGKGMDPRDLVLSIVAFSDDERISGRTVIQKIGYFANSEHSLGIDYEPHYYGPYSEDVAGALMSLVALGLIKESAESVIIREQDNLIESKKYTYQLTNRGKMLMKARRKKLQGNMEKIEDTVRRLKKAGFDLHSAYWLAFGAKTQYILMKEKRPMTAEEISIVASQLGWDIPSESVSEVANSLVKYWKSLTT